MLKGTVQRVPMDRLDLSIVRPCRTSLREEIIERYMAVTEDSADGWGFSSNVRICRVGEDGPLYVVDGQHRVEACRRLGRDYVIASVAKAKDLDEVIREARSANAKHGENLTDEELNANIAAYLLAGGIKKKNTDIAATFGVSRKRVERIRERDKIPTKKEATRAAVEAALNDRPDVSVATLADDLGIDRRTVSAFRKATETVPDEVVEETVEDTVPDEGVQNGTVYQNVQDEAKPAPVPVHQKKLPERGKTSIPHDVRGEEIPPAYWEKYGTISRLTKEAFQMVTALSKQIEAMKEVGAFHSQGDYSQTLDSLSAVRAGIKFSLPECLCSCAGQGCRKCGGVGFLSKKMFDKIVLPLIEEEQ